MKPDYKKVGLTILVSTIAAFAQLPAIASPYSKTAQNKSITSSKPAERRALEKEKKAANLAEAESKVVPDKLIEAAQAYQDKADENSYNSLWNNFVAFIQQDVAKHKDAASLFKSSKVFSQAGLKVIEPLGANASTHLYVYNHMPLNNNSFVPQTKYVLIQWSDQVISASKVSTLHTSRQKKSHLKKSKTIAALKTQIINIPGAIDVKEAAFLPRAIVASKTKGAKTSFVADRYLVISGSECQSGHTWTLALKQNVGIWSNYPDIFQDVPPFLMQSSNAKVKFSGNSLIISMGGPNGYELVMPFVDDHFAFSTKEAQDSASAIAHQFLMALQFKRLDLARVWLADSKLASIPGYLGLYSRPADSPPLRLAHMPQPISGGSRYRLITGGKDDLIVDIGKVKNQMLIKALFIAPGFQQMNLISKTSQN